MKKPLYVLLIKCNSFIIARESISHKIANYMFLPLIKPIVLVVIIPYPARFLYRFNIRPEFTKQPRKRTIANELTAFLFIAYVATVLALTILPISISNFQNPKEPGYNFVPIINTSKYLIASLASTDPMMAKFAIANIIGNLVLFIPFGIFLPLLFSACRSIKKLMLISFCCSFSIEMIQLILIQFGTYRTADIDDILLNTLGAMLGFWLISTLNEKKSYYSIHDLYEIHSGKNIV